MNGFCVSTRNAGSLIVTWFDSIYDLTIDSLLFWVRMDSSRASKSIDQNPLFLILTQEVHLDQTLSRLVGSGIRYFHGQPLFVWLPCIKLERFFSWWRPGPSPHQTTHWVSPTLPRTFDSVRVPVEQPRKIQHTTISHTPDNPPRHLWKESLYGLLVEV